MGSASTSPEARVRGSSVCAADEQAIAALEVPDMARLKYVFDAVGEIKRALACRVPLIGFSGQPVHARVLHDRRLRAAPTSRRCAGWCTNVRTCCNA
jgi:hypothetical protein